jgi:hypothetical protein
VIEKGSGLRAEGSDDSLQRDTAMPKTYVAVLILEAVIVVLLWFFQRAFS